MTLITIVFALGGFAIGVALGLLIARRREQKLAIELAVAQAQLKTQEQLERERVGAIEQAMTKLTSSFDSVAGQSLRANSEVFLKLAREHLGAHQQAAAATLTEREKAIEAMVAPIREALVKTEQQIVRIEKERAESFGNLRASIESVTLGQQAL